MALMTSVVTVGTLAYFSKTVGAGPNTIMAATIDVALTCDFELTDIYPCKPLDPITVTFENVGPIDGYLYEKVTYKQNDDTPNNKPNLTADEFAALIYIESATYQHFTYWEGTGWGWGSISDDLPNWMAIDTAGNGDGYVSLYEIKQCGWLPYNDKSPEEPLIPSDRGRRVITLHMADSLVGHVWGIGNPIEALDFGVEDNAPQSDGIDVTFSVLLKSSKGSP